MKDAVRDTPWRGKALRLLLLAVAICTAVPAVASGWKDALKRSLEASHPLTTRSFLSPDSITKEGIILVIEKPGIAADASSDLRYAITDARNVQIGEQGGGVAAVFSKKNTRVLHRGEKVCVTGITVANDYVMFELVSRNMFGVEKHASTRQTGYMVALNLTVFKEALPTMTPAQVITSVSPVITTKNQAVGAITKTISLGQTIKQVKTINLAPDMTLNLGPKVIYTY